MKRITIDEKNVKEMSIHGYNGIFTCKLCFREVDILESFSYKGWNLVCTKCYYRMRSVLTNDVTQYPSILSMIQDTGRELMIEHDNLES